MTQAVQSSKETKQEAPPKFKPLGYRVLVRRLETETALKGGIILPDTAKKKQEQAQVVSRRYRVNGKIFWPRDHT